MSDTRQHAHELIDRMPEVSAALSNAPIEDEEISEDEERAVAESIEWLKHNRAIPHEQVLAEFGLTLDDFERMGGSPLSPGQNGAGR